MQKSQENLKSNAKLKSFPGFNEKSLENNVIKNGLIQGSVGSIAVSPVLKDKKSAQETL